jgi:hypothetical protein
VHCSVRGCDDVAAQAFDAGSESTGPLEFLVCDFHGLTLDEGVSWTEDSGELVVAADQLLDWTVTVTLGRIRVALTLGDQFENRTVEFFATPSDLSRLSDLLAKVSSSS